MRFIQSLRRRLLSFWKKDASNVAIGEELQFHLERETEANIASGMTPEQARSAARASLGDLATATDQCYEARGVAWLDDLAQDLRYGLRTMMRDRAFTVVTVLTLALGIGACTAIFSLVSAVLIQSLPYGHPAQLVYLFTPSSFWNLPAEVFGPSSADFYDLQKESKSFAAMTRFNQTTYNLAGVDRVERVGAARIDANFLRTLEVTPELGRGFDAKEEQPGNAQVVLVSHGFGKPCWEDARMS